MAMLFLYLTYDTATDKMISADLPDASTMATGAARLVAQPPAARVIALIACSAAKRQQPCAAEELYQGDLFRKCLGWARRHCEEAFVLSAKHGLLALSSVVAPYNESLSSRSRQARAAWAQQIDPQLRALAARHPSASSLRFVLLAGRAYRDPLVALYANQPAPFEFTAPLQGMGIGEQKAWLKRALNCASFVA
jgi:hypothetical protein